MSKGKNADTPCLHSSLALDTIYRIHNVL